jgi:hypothetical protein
VEDAGPPVHGHGGGEVAGSGGRRPGVEGKDLVAHMLLPFSWTCLFMGLIIHGPAFLKKVGLIT